MKLKTVFVSILATCCLGMAACNPKDAPKSVEPSSEVSSEEPLSSEEPASSEEPVASSEEPHVHEFGEWTEVTAPTCTEKGSEHRLCACGEEETREVDALGHLPKTEWEVKTPATVDAEGEEVLKCSRCGAELESRKIDKLEPPTPSVDPITLTDANLLGYAGTNLSYGDGNATVNEVKFVWVEIGAYGNGLQMRTKNGKSSTIYNEDALPGALKSIKITLDSGKQVYANEHALTFSFGDSAACNKKTITWDTVADQKTYELDVGAEGCNYFKLVHSITYTLYVASIELVF